MIFVFDIAQQSTKAYKNSGQASRAVLDQLGIEVLNTADPVAILNTEQNDDFILLTLSQAFESIAETESNLREELALKFKDAVDDFYK